MKTMRRGKDIVRVKDKEGKIYLDRGYEFCPKEIWKKEVRVFKQKKEAIKENLEANTTKSGKNSKPQES